MTHVKTLPNALKRLRAELKITQKELARLLNINVSTVNRWESGQSIPKRALSMQILNAAKLQAVSTGCFGDLKRVLFPETNRGNMLLQPNEIELINQLINDSTNGVIVVSRADYSVLYINKSAADLMGLTPIRCRGKKCYSLFMHRSQPCEHCRMKKLVEGSFKEWIYISSVTNHKYLVRGKKLIWEGVPAQIKYITDITALDSLCSCSL